MLQDSIRLTTNLYSAQRSVVAKSLGQVGSAGWTVCKIILSCQPQQIFAPSVNIIL